MTTDQADRIIVLLESIDGRLARWEEPVEDITATRRILSDLSRTLGGTFETNSKDEYAMTGALGMIHRQLEALPESISALGAEHEGSDGRSYPHGPLARIQDQLSQIGLDVSIGLRGNEWHASGLSVAAEAAVDSLEQSVLSSLSRRLDELHIEATETHQLLAEIANKLTR